jgi:nicotinamidase-related amidase
VSATLIVIDLQHVFGDADSGWFTPRFAEILDPVERLVAAYEPDVVFTRFVAPAEPAGAWRAYYRRWPFAVQPPDAPLYALTERFAGRPTFDRPTFGKWGAELAERIGPVGDEIVLAGVSTDCCVLSTALPAADAGVQVTVAADACAGASDTSHEQALALMRLYAPLIEVSTADGLITARRRGG